MKIKISIIALFFLFSLNSFSQLTLSKKKYIDSLFQNRKEITFKFSVSSRQEIDSLTRIISIDNVKGNEVFAYADKKEFAKFLSLNYNFILLQHPGEMNKNPKMFDKVDIKQVLAWNAYPTYNAYESMMYQFAANYPSLCQIYNIKTLASGRKLLFAKISHNITAHENEPQFLYTSSIHGNETSGFIHMLHLIDTLLNSYGTNPRITAILDNTEIWINPLANPDGTYGASGGSSISGATRDNANGVDLNRNYPDPVGGQHPDGKVWQPETQAFMGFADTMHFVMAANFHEGSEVCNYPWDGKAALTADNNWWQYVSKQFADTAQAFGTAGFFTDVSSSGITNGYSWYQVLGGRQDYMNFFQHCREETIEISAIQSPAESSLPTLWKGCKRSFFNYIEQSLKGIRGVITDSCTGQGIRAKVYIAGHDFDSSYVYSALPVGNYHRPIYTGTYNVTYSANGYQSKTINDIYISNGNAIIQNVALKPLAPVASFIADITNTCQDTIHFTDNSGSAETWLWDFGDGTSSDLQNPSHLYTSAGTYTVQQIISNCAGSDTLIITDYITVNRPADPIVISASSCGPDSLTLTASGAGTLNWYDAPLNGNLINTGTTFTTPYLTATTIYYVQGTNIFALQTAGKPDNSGGGGNLNNADQYLIFDSYNPFTLISVDVYAGTIGTRVIELRDKSGTILQSDTVDILFTGLQTVSLNLDVPVGTAFQLGLHTGTTSNLYRNNSGVNYPYTTTGLLSVDSSSAGTQYYYFFYNWVVQETSCSSAIVPVIAAINSDVPIAAFTYVINSITANFTNTTTDGVNYHWSFGDGDTSNLKNPSHTYSANGIYTVQLIAVNGCGSDTISAQITISSVGLNETSASNEISVYPNPSNDKFNIMINSEKSENIEVEIFDILGNKVYDDKRRIDSGINHLSVEMKEKADGLYFLKIEFPDKKYLKFLMKN